MKRTKRQIEEDNEEKIYYLILDTLNEIKNRFNLEVSERGNQIVIYNKTTKNTYFKDEDKKEIIKELENKIKENDLKIDYIIEQKSNFVNDVKNIKKNKFKIIYIENYYNHLNFDIVDVIKLDSFYITKNFNLDMVIYDEDCSRFSLNNTQHINLFTEYYDNNYLSELLLNLRNKKTTYNKLVEMFFYN